MQEYWRPLGFQMPHVDFELRAKLAWDLIFHFGSVAAKRPEGADPKNDPGLDLQTPQEVVSRCFAIADAFVDVAETRKAIRPLNMDAETEAAETIKNGQMDRSETRFAAIQERQRAERAARNTGGTGDVPRDHHGEVAP